MTQVAVFVAREALRAQRRKRWLVFLAPADLPEIGAPSASEDVRCAINAFYKIIALRHSAPDDRIAFLLRHVDGMELTEVAAACDVSLSTIKRRLATAERVFREHAVGVPDLEPWIAGNPKWARAN